MVVFCVGMYRACSTWQYGVAGTILERHRGVQRLGFLDGGPFGSEVAPGLDPTTWSLLKAHDAHDRFGTELENGRALAIYGYRDLRDVAFSWAYKTGATFEDVIAGGFLERCLENDRFWRACPSTLIQSYEALISDPVEGVRAIGQHLGIELGPEEAREIAEAHSFESNRRKTGAISESLRAEGHDPSPQDQDSYDRDSLLHWNHLRDGKAGGWRHLATPDQRATLARICGAWLVDHGYEPDSSWANLDDWSKTPRVSYAQNMEDILLDRLFRGQKGTFIDVGANHPTHLNNTYFFYLRGWRGVNVEPVLSARALFEAARPEDLNLSIAASDEAGEMPFYEIPECTGLSSLSAEAAQEQSARGLKVIEHRVPVMTVASMVEQYKLAPPEIFSIDVEGNEEQVLRGIPLADWQPVAFVIESTRPLTNSLCHEGWEPILLEHGYLFATFDGINRYYLRGDQAHALPLFAYPVNALDFYERFDVVEQREKAEAIARLRHEELARAEETRAALERELSHSRQETAHLATARAEDRALALAEQSRERDAWQCERDAWQRERDAIQRERDSVQRERDSVQRERDSVQQERDARHVERESWATERAELYIQVERSSRQIEFLEVELARLREDLVREDFRLREAHQALQAEREQADRERKYRAAEADSLPRRPRLLDRLGVSSLGRGRSQSSAVRDS
ncbi:FkbM family methyltransferase [Tundrisphaera lichenicola]|uniref:FkbM family methyltransferase n=1 Tax=Tundrisphaera lichenicola TaxID=2029860 RepID=UPI003EBB78B0